MRWYKRFLKSSELRNGLCWLASGYMRFVRITGRWETRGAHIPSDILASGRPFILAFWHQRLLMMPFPWMDIRKGRKFYMLISAHRDGEIISRTVKHFDIDSIAGSTGKGGSAALRSMLKALKSGDVIGFTPDGPRGPRMRASDGVVQAARMSGAPVIPLSYAVSRRKVFKSWDRFILPFPFSRGVFLWGDPIYVDRGLDDAGLEAKRQEIENALTQLGQKGDRELGMPIIDPASPDEKPKQKRSAQTAGATGTDGGI
ncbi:lysophospholipid acyltransferase family protein [Thalassospira sp.]|uniref:lysophospholipid acyltransferase family protein n=1 Tax=Thalassospira sp. TaxID=1912094 RepID=UPI002734979D|nr:lysophospholipid acyltransferase family protein [Thalassospira sp.]MDP2699637.1 lysophospholipid acyltransferase family protein [Thalassospira sp.]